MIIQWKQWRIKSTDFGFQVERKINPTRWKAEMYYMSLAQAIQGLLVYRIRTETVDCVIDAMDAASARAGTAKLVKKIDTIANEICKALNDFK